jgi:hypothetical protein
VQENQTGREFKGTYQLVVEDDDDDDDILLGEAINTVQLAGKTLYK